MSIQRRVPNYHAVSGQRAGEELKTMTTIGVRAAEDSDQQAVIDVITLAFSNDPMARWAFPHPATYLAVMPRLARAFGGNGFAHGAAHLVDGGLAAAMWLPPGVEPDVEQMTALNEQHVPADRLDDMMQVFERMEQFHPTDPCWYLPLIGVDPSCQGRGFGSALLRHATAQCDRDGMPAYLESSSPRNIPLYQRHGFEIMGSIQVGTSPTLVPMLRRPR
jgi:ribosomal protein S18 acetylase RimI-like enzyme